MKRFCPPRRHDLVCVIEPQEAFSVSWGFSIGIRRICMRFYSPKWLLPALALGLLVPAPAQSACCYFSAKNTDILQPAQKVFITWDPSEKVETFTVQPKFEGNALDFGMVIPTPTQPKLHEMPRDFFKHLAVYSIMKRRESPQSKLLPQRGFGRGGA